MFGVVSKEILPILIHLIAVIAISHFDTTFYADALARMHRKFPICLYVGLFFVP